jgi:dCTP diphosphatase
MMRSLTSSDSASGVIFGPWHLSTRWHPAAMAFTDRNLEDIRHEVAAFAAERAWEQFHSPRNLLLALVGEVGEAAEILRWQGDAAETIPPDKRDDWADELADVLTLLVRLADRSGVDLTAAFATKLEKARLKYPVDLFKGSNRKYSDPKPAP